jgi:hypothetical protein
MPGLITGGGMLTIVNVYDNNNQRLTIILLSNLFSLKLVYLLSQIMSFV